MTTEASMTWSPLDISLIVLTVAGPVVALLSEKVYPYLRRVVAYFLGVSPEEETIGGFNALPKRTPLRLIYVYLRGAVSIFIALVALVALVLTFLISSPQAVEKEAPSVGVIQFLKDFSPEGWFLILAVVFGFSVTWAKGRAIVSFLNRLAPATMVLGAFAVLVFVFACAALINYRDRLSADLIFLAVGLLFAMIFGMFVQVLVSNHNQSKPLLEVSSSQLVFPLLFSPMVYFPIWSLASSHPSTFSVYAAFLNGYFWEHVVTSTRPIATATRDGGPT